jgi:hypothetical protein
MPYILRCQAKNSGKMGEKNHPGMTRRRKFFAPELLDDGLQIVGAFMRQSASPLSRRRFEAE